MRHETGPRPWRASACRCSTGHKGSRGGRQGKTQETEAPDSLLDVLLVVVAQSDSESQRQVLGLLVALALHARQLENKQDMQRPATRASMIEAESEW